MEKDINLQKEFITTVRTIMKNLEIDTTQSVVMACDFADMVLMHSKRYETNEFHEDIEQAIKKSNRRHRNTTDDLIDKPF